jgi:hypothetical protein
MMRPLVLVYAFAISSCAWCAQPIGRLFFTPAERAQLDIGRTQKQHAPEVAAAAPVEPTPASQIITYSGIVRRSDGKSILWLNNRPAEEKEALSGLAVSGRVGPDGAVTLQVPQTGATVNLKVGQRAELQTGKVAEARPAAPPVPAKNDAIPAKPPENESTEKKSDAPAMAASKSPVAGSPPDNAEELRLRARTGLK